MEFVHLSTHPETECDVIPFISSPPHTALDRQPGAITGPGSGLRPGGEGAAAPGSISSSTAPGGGAGRRLSGGGVELSSSSSDRMYAPVQRVSGVVVWLWFGVVGWSGLIRLPC